MVIDEPEPKALEECPVDRKQYTLVSNWVCSCYVGQQLERLHLLPPLTFYCTEMWKSHTDTLFCT